MSYAKGNWKAEDMGDYIEITTPYRQRDNKVCIAKVGVGFGEPFNKEQIDSANLIAAAPALLEALEMAREQIVLYRHDAGFEPEDCDAIEKIDAAIAAARGEE